MSITAINVKPLYLNSRYIARIAKPDYVPVIIEKTANISKGLLTIVIRCADDRRTHQEDTT